MTLQQLIDAANALGKSRDTPLMVFCDNCHLLEMVENAVPNGKVLQLNMERSWTTGAQNSDTKDEH